METQVAVTMEERVCGLACWASQAFEYDLTIEDKALLEEMAKNVSSPGMILHLLFIDLAKEPRQPLVGRCGFRQIITSHCDYIRSVDVSDRPNIHRDLRGAEGLWKCVLFYHDRKDSDDIAEKLKGCLDGGHTPFVICVQNVHVPLSCTFVLNFSMSSMPPGRDDNL